MGNFDWKPLLTQWSKELLASGLDLSEGEVKIPSASISSEWLGYSGAIEEQIVETENRLGVLLPPSYREFLKITNGWPRISDFIYKLWSVQEIDWLATKHQDLINIWMEMNTPVPDEEYLIYGEKQNPLSIRTHYLQTALEVSDKGDQAFFLLNPEIITVEGEWEAWFFAQWIQGARRYRSFWEMMQEEHQLFLMLR